MEPYCGRGPVFFLPADKAEGKSTVAASWPSIALIADRTEKFHPELQEIVNPRD
jgi:hypothetical protein